MNIMLYGFALTRIQQEFGFTPAIAGAVASVTLLSSAAGGIVFGYVADRFGRTKALGIAILAYSAFTVATAHNPAELMLWRLLVGLGMGWAWVAGAALVAEEWPAEHRGKTIGILQSGWAVGYIAAALLSAWIIPAHGWRVLFVMGVGPALLAIWIWRDIQEPEAWRAVQWSETSIRYLFTAPLRRTIGIATAVSSALMFAYWGLFTWVPAYLSSPRENGSAGMSIVQSASWIIPMQIGPSSAIPVSAFWPTALADGQPSWASCSVRRSACRSTACSQPRLRFCC